jgi:hypothetical protein
LEHLVDGEVADRLGPGRLPKLRLEFFVPPDLLGADTNSMDWWPWNSSAPLCSRFSVLLRSLTRNDRMSERQNCAEKWDRLAVTRRAGPPAVRFTPSPNGSLSGRPTEDLCVVLTEQLPAGSFRGFHDELLRSGTPAAFWPASARVAAAFREEAPGLVGEALLAGLPRRLREWQRASPERGEVVLFWDDPDRCLPVGRPYHRIRR